MLAAPLPAQATLIRDRGIIFARQGQWPRAAEDFARAIELQSEAIHDWAILACLRLLAGDTGAYRNIRVEVLRRPGQGDNSLRTALIGCLGDQLDEPDKVVVLAQASAKKVESAPEAANVLALALYRAGRLDEAIGRIEKSPKGSAAQQGIGNLIRGLCLLRRGRTEEGRAARTEADRIFAHSLPSPESPLTVSWLLHDLWFLLLHAELEAGLTNPMR